MAPRPTVVEMSHSSPSPTGSDVTGGEMANPMALTPTPPASPSPPPHLPDAGDAALVHHQPGLNNNNHYQAEEEEEPLLPELHPFMPLPPYRSDMEEAIPFSHRLEQVLRHVCGTDDLRSVRQLRLRVISKEMSLQRVCLHVNRLQELTLDGSSLTSLRDLGCSLSQMRKLSVARCGLDSLDGLFGLMSLRELLAPDNSVDDIGPCAVLQHLQRLDLSRNQVPDVRNISFLRTCVNLKHLSMAGCPASAMVHYRTSVESKLPDLLTLDGISCQGKQGAEDEDDAPGELFSGSSGNSEDEDEYPRPSRAHLESLLKMPSRETLPPLQHHVASLPPLRPLHPLPPIRSHGRTSSARCGDRSTASAHGSRPRSAAAATSRWPSPPASGEVPSRAPAAVAIHSRCGDGQSASAGTSPRDLGLEGAAVVSRLSAELRERCASVGDGGQVSANEHRRLAESSNNSVRGSEKEKPRQKCYSTFTHGSANGDVASFSTPVTREQEAPRRGTSASSLPTKKSAGCNTNDQNPLGEMQHGSKALTRGECLTLHMEERVKRWTDHIMDDPTLETLERLSLLAAEEQDGGGSSNADEMADPNSRTDPRPPISRKQ